MLRNVEDLFFDLIRVSLGNSYSLSYTPDAMEWEQLYRLSINQSISGICFGGVKRLPREEQTMPRSLHGKWLGYISKVQNRNLQLNEACKSVYNRLKQDGFDCCILKGQSLTPYYGDLAMLRQSGDVDVLVANDDLPVLKYALRIEGTGIEWTYKHVHVNSLCCTTVDLHYRLAMSRNLSRNKKLQKWCDEIKKAGFVYNDGLGFATLKLDDNVVFILYHIFWHFLFEGVGLRQVMDLFFLLRYADRVLLYEEKENINARLKAFGFEKFASAVSWVMWYVFEGKNEKSMFLSENAILPYPNEREGSFLLSEIMKSGNMGYADLRIKRSVSDNAFSLFVKKFKFYSRLCFNYPAEFLWMPFGSLYVHNWRRKINKMFI